MHAWSVSQVSMLIGLYKKCEFMYNSHHKHYKCLWKREEAYSLICMKMRQMIPNITKDDIKHEIRLLKVQYNFEKNKLMKARAINDEPYVPSLWCFNMLSFLDECNTSPNATHQDKEQFEEENGDSAEDCKFYDSIFQPTHEAIDPHLTLVKVINTIQLANESLKNYNKPKQKSFGYFIEEELEEIKDPTIRQEARWNIQIALRDAILNDQEKN